jgi:predicted nucleic acid-binding protein
VLTADTNIFVYAIDARDPRKHEIAKDVRDRLKAISAPIGLQVVSEFYSAVTRRLRRMPWEAAQGARNLMASYPCFAISSDSISRALAEASAGRFSYWDALLLATADLAGCTVLLTEDMTDGARLGGVEVVHVFGPDGISERAQAALAAPGAIR